MVKCSQEHPKCMAWIHVELSHMSTTTVLNFLCFLVKSSPFLNRSKSRSLNLHSWVAWFFYTCFCVFSQDFYVFSVGKDLINMANSWAAWMMIFIKDSLPCCFCCLLCTLFPLKDFIPLGFFLTRFLMRQMPSFLGYSGLGFGLVPSSAFVSFFLF